MNHFLNPTVLTIGLLFLAPATVAVAQAPATVPQGAGAFQGEFRGDDLVLVLRRDADGYVGSLTVAGARYDCRAVDDASTLRGRFRVQTQEFTFTMVRHGDGFRLESDGAAHELRAVGGQQPAAGGLPAWLHPGVRITYWGGSRSVPGSAQSYVPDPDGNININGKNYKLDDNAGSAGAGYSQYDIVDVNAAGIGVRVCNYVPVDAQMQNLTLTGSQPVTGDGSRIGDFWINPAVLAAMPEDKTPTSLVRRLRYPLDGQVYDAVTTQICGPDSFSRNTYDLATGLLLVHTSSSTGKGGLAPAGNGYAGNAQGVTTIVSSRLVAVRELGLPWAKQGVLPQWLQPGQHLRYSGTCTNSLGKGIVAPWRYDLDLGIERVCGGFALAQMQTRLDYGYGSQPQDSSQPMIYGAGMIGALWIDPATLRALPSDRPLDQDPVTRRSLRCVGNDGRIVAILEQGPVDGVQFTYDLQNGMLIAIAQRRQQGPATIDYQLQLNR